MEKILHLILYKKWFMEILEGKKKEEYRDKTPFWMNRLFEKDGSPKKYDYVMFRNGYRKDAPVMKVEFLGIEDRGKNLAILLGKIVERERVTNND